MVQNIMLLTVGYDTGENWIKTFTRLEKLSIYGRTYQLRQVAMHLEERTMEDGFIADLEVRMAKGEVWPRLVEVAFKAFQNMIVSKLAFEQLRSNEENGTDPWVEVGFDLPDRPQVVDRDGRTAIAHGFTVVVGYRSKYRGLEMRSVSYDGQELAAGGYFDKGGADFAHVAINDVEGALNATIEVSANFLPKVGRSA
jgi:hypothetical protein